MVLRAGTPMGAVRVAQCLHRLLRCLFRERGVEERYEDDRPYWRWHRGACARPDDHGSRICGVERHALVDSELLDIRPAEAGRERLVLTAVERVRHPLLVADDDLAVQRG